MSHSKAEPNDRNRLTSGTLRRRPRRHSRWSTFQPSCPCCFPAASHSAALGGLPISGALAAPLNRSLAEDLYLDRRADQHVRRHDSAALDQEDRTGDVAERGSCEHRKRNSWDMKLVECLLRIAGGLDRTNRKTLVHREHDGPSTEGTSRSRYGDSQSQVARYLDSWDTSMPKNFVGACHVLRGTTGIGRIIERNAHRSRTPQSPTHFGRGGNSFRIPQACDALQSGRHASEQPLSKNRVSHPSYGPFARERKSEVSAVPLSEIMLGLM